MMRPGMPRPITNLRINTSTMKIHEIVSENTAGAFASVAMPMGKMIKRPNPSVFPKKKKKTNPKIK